MFNHIFALVSVATDQFEYFKAVGSKGFKENLSDDNKKWF